MLIVLCRSTSDIILGKVKVSIAHTHTHCVMCTVGYRRGRQRLEECSLNTAHLNYPQLIVEMVSYCVCSVCVYSVCIYL